MVREQVQELYGAREHSYSLGLAEIVHASLVREAIDLLTRRRLRRKRRSPPGRRARR
jgi:hypothetical protein